MNNTNWAVSQSTIALYLQACKEAAEDDNKFVVFKRDPRYTPVLEHVSKEEAELFVREMKTISITKGNWKLFRENDIFGGPKEVFHFPLYGHFTPSTIRYIKQALDIYNFFGEIEGNIVEIGGGYGGLTKVLSVLNNFEHYSIIDLPEANALAFKYLNKFPELDNRHTHFNPEYVSSRSNPNRLLDNPDLVISNYAFSECSTEIQLLYYEKIIRKAHQFYMVYNDFTVGNLGPKDFLRLASKDFTIHIEAEIRPAHINFIFYGTKKD